MTTEVIPTTPIVHPVKDEVILDTCLGNDDFSSVEKLSPEIELNRDDILEEAQPPPPYSQTCSLWDEMSIEQLLEKSREITQVESLLQTILSDQTFAMHDLRSQLSDEEVMKQVVTVKALTENIIASKTDATTKPSITSTLDIKVSEEKSSVRSIPDEFCFNNPTPALSANLTTPSNNLSISQQPSRVPSRTTSRTPSRAPSRASSRPPSKSDSRAVSPNRTSSRSSSKQKRDQSVSTVPNSLKNDKIDENPKINEDDDEEEGSGDTSLDRMNVLLNSLINEATEAVETPIKGREKKLRRTSSSNQPGFDFSDILNELDALEEEDEEEDKSSSSRGLKREKVHERAKSKNVDNFEGFENKMLEIGQSLEAFGHLVDEITTEESMVQEDYGLQYLDSTADLIKNPSENLADLDYFAQQCRILTRAFILPFLWATNNFMSESLQTTDNINNSRGIKRTLRTFMNLMYWTFLFTLGSLVLDAWLCEVAGRQVIRMVDSLKPAQPFGMIYEDGDYKIRKFEDEELISDDSDELEIVDIDSSEDEESYIEYDNEEDLAHLLRQKITNEWLKRAGHEKNIFDNKDNNYAKNNIDNVSTLIEKSDILENTFVTYKKTPTMINKTKNIRQVKRVVLRRPKRNGPFGGSDGFLVTKTHKIRTRNMTNQNIQNMNLNKINRNMGHNRKSVSISISKNQSSKSLSHSKRSRRFSI
ncbi:8903_t:CDS:2 [Diversispora eburnea]|uniref:8903_t:CDS:1 n=1 Tax=Diversispora eburnea TaxID=1213867 RepID=A0A9N8Z028_9GLOM|nr:8903_t:CDS:2 [Diversispora eburnea]